MLCSIYTVNCVHTSHCELFFCTFIHCTLYNAHWTLYTALGTTLHVNCTLYIVQYAVNIAQCIVHFKITYIYVSFSEVVEMKKACGDAHMKSILAIGELGSMENVYKVIQSGSITLWSVKTTIIKF